MRRSLLLLSLCALLAAADPWDALAAASRLPAAEARPALEKLLLENPGFHAARFNLGTLLLDSDPAKAAEQLELATAAAAPETVVDAWYNLALARFRQGRLEDALRSAEKAAELDPATAPLRNELRRVVLARQDEARRKAEEEARKLHLNPAPLPIGRVGEDYHGRLPIAGGRPPATATLAGSSKLPEGLSLAADGGLSGVPRQAGSFHLDLALADSAGAKATAATELHVLPAPAITTSVLPEAITGQPYSARLAAVGLDAPVRWTVGALPAGLEAGPDGVIAGTPTAAGTVQLACRASDGTRQAERQLELVVSDGFAPAENPLPPATANVAYQHRATVRGPAQDYRWSCDQAAALTVAADGTVSGTPAQPGELAVPVTISGADGRTRSTNLVVPVNPQPLIQPEPITLHVGEPTDQALRVAGGTPPFAWSVVRGALPAGVRLDADGHLRGAAKDPGSFAVTVAVEDNWKAGTQAEQKISVEPAADPPPQDQAKQDEQKDQKDQKDQKGKQDQKDQKGQQGKQDQKDQQGKQEQKDQQGKQEQKDQQAQKDEQGSGQDKDKKEGEAAAAAQLNQAAAGSWLDQLPKEDRGVLRYQLLEGGDNKPKQKGNPW